MFGVTERTVERQCLRQQLLAVKLGPGPGVAAAGVQHVEDVVEDGVSGDQPGLWMRHPQALLQLLEPGLPVGEGHDLAVHDETVRALGVQCRGDLRERAGDVVLVTGQQARAL